VRVHIVDSAVFATAIHSTAVDYRAATWQVGKPPKFTDYRLPENLSEQCIQLSKALGLTVAGIDLKITPDNEAFCFEVNPGPAFTFYEMHTGQPITHAIAHYLAMGYV
jgi:glutathione synthase/RimK-type ligase-like ATP-grasp enzyme